MTVQAPKKPRSVTDKGKRSKNARVIKFNFQPYQIDKGNHVFTKVENGKKRRYLRGIASGPKVDFHNERMSKDCVESFHKQATDGQVLLYTDIHGIKASESIGLLTGSEVDKDGDWIIDCRLWDSEDGLAVAMTETADTVFKMVTGAKPFKKKKQFGFSIEGIIEDIEKSIIQDDEGRNILNDIDLDGVVLVPRPSYKTSMASGVYKALGLLTPWQVRKTLTSFMNDKENRDESRSSYWEEKWDLDHALDIMIEEIMSNANVDNKREQIDMALQEYISLALEIIMRHEDAFVKDEDLIDENVDVERARKNQLGKRSVRRAKNQRKRSKLFAKLNTQLNKLDKVRRKKSAKTK